MTRPIKLGVNIPLNYDPYTDLTIGFASTGNTGPFQRFKGKLDAATSMKLINVLRVQPGAGAEG